MSSLSEKLANAVMGYPHPSTQPPNAAASQAGMRPGAGGPGGLQGTAGMPMGGGTPQAAMPHPGPSQPSTVGPKMARDLGESLAFRAILESLGRR